MDPNNNVKLNICSVPFVMVVNLGTIQGTVHQANLRTKT